MASVVSYIKVISEVGDCVGVFFVLFDVYVLYGFYVGFIHFLTLDLSKVFLNSIIELVSRLR